MCQGEAIKTALLFLSITRISTRFSEIPPQSGANLKDFPLQMPPKWAAQKCHKLLELTVFIWC